MHCLRYGFLPLVSTRLQLEQAEVLPEKLRQKICRGDLRQGASDYDPEAVVCHASDYQREAHADPCGYSRAAHAVAPVV